MKTFKILLLLLIVATIANSQPQKVIFLHHSTGGLMYQDGSVPELMEEYNKQNGTSYSITERAFPNKPYPWANYAYDYWNIWINGYCEEEKGTDEYKNVECLETLTKEYEVIILKHCFPGADVLEDTGSPDITSSRKSLENYKLQYRALREKFNSFPDNDFVVWTLAPRHRLKTNAPANARRAKEFVDWVKNDWLTEDGKSYSNIHIFDYFSYTAEMDPNVSAPSVPYCLKYDHERSHEGSDSHPNLLGCKEIGPEFFKSIIKILAGK